jgi:Capsule assembly protein Wzi
LGFCLIVHSLRFNLATQSPMRVGIFLFLVVYICANASAQDSLHTKTTFVEAKIGAASEQTPFWLWANRYGTVPNQLPLLQITAARQVLQPFKKNTNWKWSYGAEVVANLGKTTDVRLPVAYGALQYKNWELYAGRRKETFGLCDTTLGMGSYVWSGNALPMPKIALQMLRYANVPFTKGWLKFKGYYAHGWFGEHRFVSHNFLHQKTLYIQLGKPQSKFKLHGGFTHQVMWGGIANYDAVAVANDGRFPSDFQSYLYVVTGLGGVVGNIRSVPNGFDSTNRVGNHLGTLDLGVEISLKTSRLFIYRQTIYEDGTPFYGGNLTDGLHGIVWNNEVVVLEKRKFIVKKVLAEFLDTRSQGGNIFYAGAQRNNNYFNHSQFRDGWSYQGRIIGTPFITNRFDTQKQFQSSDFHNGFETANNNRVSAFLVGVEGYFGEQIQFLSKFSYSKNLGTYGFPYPSKPRQYSGLVQVMGRLPYWSGLQWTSSVAWDYGALFDDSVGLQVGIRKNW